MDTPGSEGRAPMAEPGMEEMEAVGCGTTSSPALPRQDLTPEGEQPREGATLLGISEEEEEDKWGQVVPSVSCLPCQEGSGLEEETAMEEDKDENKSQKQSGEGEVSVAPTLLELEGLLPRAEEEGDSGDPPGPTAAERRDSSTETRQDRPLVAGFTSDPVGFMEDQAQGGGQPEDTLSCCIQAEEPLEEPECPICTELYDQEGHRPAPLNCGHILCGQCLQAIMEAGSAADIGRVRCPICRQKTPMMEWEICRLQEELLLLGATQGPSVGAPATLFFNPLPARRPGFWGGLEHHFQVRFHTTRMVGFMPCFRYPPRLIRGLARLEERCPWGYRLALLGLLTMETLSLLLVFLPIALLLLLFLIMDQ